MKKILTGSNISQALESDSSNDESLKECDEKLLGVLDELVDQLFAYEIKKTLYHLNPPPSGFTRHWFVNFKTKMMESFPAKMEVELIEALDEDNYLCYVGECHIIVNKDYLSHKVEF